MNPELQRNLWLDATPRKLAFAAAILAGLFAAVWLLDRGRHAYAVTLAGSVVFFGAALVWAPRAARATVIDEVRAGSWDFQRLSALTPWEMTWGKLAGATARPWVAAGGGLLLAALQLASTSSLRHAAFWVMVALGLAVTLQASGLATGLIDLRRARANGRLLSVRAPGLLLLTLALLSLAVLVWARARVGQALGRLELHAGTGAPAVPISWFGHGFAPLTFLCPDPARPGGLGADLGLAADAAGAAVRQPALGVGPLPRVRRRLRPGLRSWTRCAKPRGRKALRRGLDLGGAGLCRRLRRTPGQGPRPPVRRGPPQPPDGAHAVPPAAARPSEPAGAAGGLGGRTDALALRRADGRRRRAGRPGLLRPQPGRHRLASVRGGGAARGMRACWSCCSPSISPAQAWDACSPADTGRRCSGLAAPCPASALWPA